MVIVYGGSFNPPTIAHVILTKYIINTVEPDKFLVVPTFDPPHKSPARMNVDERFDMVKETFSEINGAVVTDIEYKLKGVSYTYKTIEELKKEYDDLYLLVGMDSFLSFEKWVKPDIILKNSKIMVAKRGGYEFRTSEIYEKNKDRFVFIDNPVIEMSSSFVRDEIKNGKDVRFFVTDKTYDYINEFLRWYDVWWK